MDNTNKTVFITGASSGIGLTTALYFFERGWNVVATMRNPDKRHTPLHEKGLDMVHVDVTDTNSIRVAIQHTLAAYQKIDVLVNNAGYGIYGPFEAATSAQVARQFDTNILGLMEVTREILPIFRQQRNGILINVASIGGRITFPLYSVYNSTKWAIEGFTEALQYELKPLNIKVKIIEPGVIKTDFFDRSLEVVDSTTFTEDYDDILTLTRGQKYMREAALRIGAEPKIVAQTIYRAATDGNWRLRYPIGNDAWLILFLRWLLPEGMFYWLVKKMILDS